MKTTIAILVITLFALALVPFGAVRAQVPPISNKTQVHRLYLYGGWDAAGVNGIGYSRALESSDIDGLWVDFGWVFPTFLLHRSGASKIFVGVTALSVDVNDVGIAFGGHTSLAYASDATGRKVSWGLDMSAQPGYYTDSWSVALDTGWRTALATYMNHSEDVRDLFRGRYLAAEDEPDAPGPRDGWYRFAANRLRVGVSAGFRKSSDVYFLAGGFEYTPQAQGIIANPAIGQLPFYVLQGYGHGSDK